MPTLFRTGAALVLAGAALAACEHEPERIVVPAPATPGPVPPPTDSSVASQASTPPPEYGYDGGLAWCTAPDPESVQWSTQISPTTVMKIFAGGCVPTDHYYRACDDAGLPVFAPTCNDSNTGKRLDVIRDGHVLVTLRADTIEGVPGPAAGDTWPIGADRRAVIVKTQTKMGENVREELRVVALGGGKDEEWGPPAEEFGKVAVYPKDKVFTFWRKAYCMEQVGCTTARWEASSAGIRLTVNEKQTYDQERTAVRNRMQALRDESPTCPVPALLGAARVYALSRLLGDSPKSALTEYDHLLTGLSTKQCAGSQFGKQKPMGVIRQDLVRGLNAFLAKTPRAPKSKS